MAWIELHQSVWTHRKTLMLGHALGLPPAYAAAHMMQLWCWALDNAQDGDLSGLPAPVIAAGAGWTGDPDQFVEAAVSVGFLDRDGETLRIHDWEDYAGKLIERRTQHRERMRQIRAKTLAARDANVNSTQADRAELPNRTVPNHTQPEIEDRETAPPDAVDEPDDAKPARKAAEYTSDFEEFWSAYPRKVGKKAAFDKWRARLKEGVTPGELIMAARHYAEICAQDGREERYIMHPETFLGPRERWKDYLAPPQPTTRARDAPKPARQSNIFIRTRPKKDDAYYEAVIKRFD